MDIEERMTETFNMMMTAETRQQLDELAAAENRSRADYLRALILREYRLYKADMGLSRAQVKKTLAQVEGMLSRLQRAVDERGFEEVEEAPQ